MALATEDDVEAALGRPLTSTETVTNLLETASDLVVGILGYRPDPVADPDTVRDAVLARVVADMVKSVLLKPAVTAADYDAGGYNTYREATTVRVGVESATTGGPWETKSLRKRLRLYIRSAVTVSVMSDGENTAMNAWWDTESDGV